MEQHTKHILDVVSISTVIATMASWLPPLASLLTIIWTGMRIWEMWTGRYIADRRKIRREK